MRSDNLDDLAARVVRLEKQNRLFRVAFILISILAVCILTLGNTRVSETVEAQRFVLRSADGKVRAELATIDGNYPRLSLISPNGEKNVHISPIGISVIDKALPGDLPLAYLGGTGLYFTNQTGHVVMELGGASTSSPQLTPIPEIKMFNEKGQPSWHAP